MKIDKDLLKRFKFYGIGFSLGVILLIVFFNGKKTRCNWFPNERILNIIRQKHIQYSDEITTLINSKTIDSTTINLFLLNGDIDFSKSLVKNKPCRKYWINGQVKTDKAVLHVKICDSIAIIDKLDITK
jgi:hypothetical protein